MGIGGIESDTFAPGKGGSIFVTVDGQLTIEGTGVRGTGIAANSLPGASGDAGAAGWSPTPLVTHKYRWPTTPRWPYLTGVSHGAPVLDNRVAGKHIGFVRLTIVCLGY